LARDLNIFTDKWILHISITMKRNSRTGIFLYLFYITASSQVLSISVGNYEIFKAKERQNI